MQAHGPHGRGQTLSLVSHLTDQVAALVRRHMIGLIQMKATEQTTETMPVALKQQKQLQQSVKKEYFTSKSCYTSA